MQDANLVMHDKTDLRVLLSQNYGSWGSTMMSVLLQRLCPRVTFAILSLPQAN